MQTIPQNVRFEANKKYKVTFNYQAEAKDYSFVIGDNTEILTEHIISPQFETQKYVVTFTGAISGNSWFGFI